MQWQEPARLRVRARHDPVRAVLFAERVDRLAAGDARNARVDVPRRIAARVVQ